MRSFALFGLLACTLVVACVAQSMPTPPSEWAYGFSMNVLSVSFADSIGMGAYSQDLGASRVDVSWTLGAASVYNLWSKNQGVLFLWDAQSNSTSCVQIPAVALNFSVFSDATFVTDETVRGMTTQQFALAPQNDTPMSWVWVGSGDFAMFNWLKQVVVMTPTDLNPKSQVSELNLFQIPSFEAPDASWYVPPVSPSECNSTMTAEHDRLLRSVSLPHTLFGF